MNHLAHFSVSHPDPNLIVGGFLGDFVKGRLKGDLPEEIERGIQLHRAVDAFSDRHPITRQSVSRFKDEFRRYGPIMVDIIYDHFLAISWDDFCDDEMSVFCDEVFAALDDQGKLLPPAAKLLADRLCETRSMLRYDERRFVERSFASIGQRLQRANPMDEAFDEFERHREELFEDFRLFFPTLMEFCRDWQQQH